MKSRKNKLWKGFIPYLITNIIPILALIILQIIYNNILFDQTNAFNDFAEEEIANEISRTMTEMRSVYRNLSKRSSLDEISAISTAPSFREYYVSKHINDNIKPMLANAAIRTASIDTIYVYIEKDNIVLSPQGALRADVFYEANIMDKNISYDDWVKTLTDNSVGEHFSNISDKNKKQYALYSFLLRNDNNKGCIVMGAVLEKDALFLNISDVDWRNSCDTYVFDSDGQTIIEYSQNADQNIPKIKTIEEMAKVNKKNNILISPIYFDEYKSYNMYTVVHDNAHLRLPRLAQLCSFFIMLLNIVFSVYMLIKIAQKNYRPIFNTMTLLNKDGKKLEYKIIEESVRELLKSNNELRESVDSQKQIAAAALLEKLLYNEIVPEIDFLLKKYGIVFAHSGFVVMVFYFYEMYIDEKNYEKFEKVFSNSVIESFEDSESCAYLTRKKKNGMVCIINTAAEGKNEVRRLAQLMAYAYKILNNTFDFRISIGVSSLKYGYSSIPSAYYEALEALHQKERDLGHSVICLYDDVKNNEKIYTAAQYEDNIIEFVREGNTVCAEKEIEKRFADLSRVSPEVTEYILYDLICFVLKLPYVTGVEIGSELKEKLSLVNFLPLIKNNSMLKERMLEIVRDVCKLSKKKKASQKNHFIELAVEYIQKNYPRDNLTLQDISDYLHYSPTYFSTLFKENQGITPMEYITRYRIEKAKELICQNISISKVCTNVGFSNIRTFNRAFKRITHITPTEYRAGTIEE